MFAIFRVRFTDKDWSLQRFYCGRLYVSRNFQRNEMPLRPTIGRTLNYSSDLQLKLKEIPVRDERNLARTKKEGPASADLVLGIQPIRIRALSAFPVSELFIWESTDSAVLSLGSIIRRQFIFLILLECPNRKNSLMSVKFGIYFQFLRGSNIWNISHLQCSI